MYVFLADLSLLPSTMSESTHQLRWLFKNTFGLTQVTKGASVSLNCLVSSTRVKTTLWYWQGGTQGQEPVQVIPDNVRILEDQQRFTIRDVSQQDIGQYFCRAENLEDKNLGFVYILSDSYVKEVCGVDSGMYTQVYLC